MSPVLPVSRATESFDGEANPFLLATDQDKAHNEAESFHQAESRKLSRRWMLIILFIIHLAIGMGGPMLQGPMTRIVESIACQKENPNQALESGRMPENLCKNSEVQKEVATIMGYREFFNGLLTSLLGLPYGLLADRYGRKPIFRLASVGFVVNAIILFVPLVYPNIFPLWTIWFSALSWFLGGGPVTVFAILWAMIADATTDAQRGPIFLRFGIGGVAAEVFANTTSSVLMNLNPWIPIAIGSGLIFIGLLVSNLLPETLNTKLPSQKSMNKSTVESMDYSEENHQINTHDSYLTILCSKLRKSVSPYRFLSRNYSVLIILPVFLIHQLSGGAGFLMQFISVRLTWNLADANLLISLQHAITIPLLFFVLPYLSQRLHRYLSPLETDLLLARISLICLATGMLGISLSSNLGALVIALLFQAAGAGFLLVTRSIVTALVSKGETARLYTLIEALQSTGEVLASLFITNTLKWGLDKGGIWVGIPWMITSLLFALMIVVLYMLRLSKP